MCAAGYALVVVLVVLLGPSCTNSDNFALLMDTLKTVNRTVCNDDTVSLECPRGTLINIQEAQYANEAHDSCLLENVPSTALEKANKKCKRPNAMQYSLLQKVIQACQQKAKCAFSTKLEADVVDPCPFTKKYVEVSYKCRPYEFKSLTGCEDDVMKLSCTPHTRLAILDAQLGHNAPDLTTCPQIKGMPDDICDAPYVFEKVIQLCLGRRHCQIIVNSQTYESSCTTNSKPYLKVTFACVPLGVIAKKYESVTESEDTRSVNRLAIENKNGDFIDESEKSGNTNEIVSVVGPAFRPASGQSDIKPTHNNDAGNIYQPKMKSERKKDNMSVNAKIIIYVGVVVLILTFVLIIFIGYRCYKTQKQKTNSKNGDLFTTDPPNVFNDAMSDIDNDVDISHISGTFYDPVHPDMILYRDGTGTKGTLRAMKPLSTIYPCVGTSMYGNVDYVPPQPIGFTRFNRNRSKEEEREPDAMTSPKSLGTYSNSQFYYG